MEGMTWKDFFEFISKSEFWGPTGIIGSLIAGFLGIRKYRNESITNKLELEKFKIENDQAKTNIEKSEREIHATYLDNIKKMFEVHGMQIDNLRSEFDRESKKRKDADDRIESLEKKVEEMKLNVCYRHSCTQRLSEKPKSNE